MDKLFTDAVRSTKTQSQSSDQQDADAVHPKDPNAVVLGKDGKPCRSCTSKADFLALTRRSATKEGSSITMAKSTPPAAATASPDPPPDCPPDVEELGRGAWSLLHSISASYPRRASATQQSEMRQFLGLFGKLYPCWVCAEDFQEWMLKKGNEPHVESRDGLGRWMCEAHNEVNRKLGKQEFDCGKWEERWRTGWKDGRCD
ncbi:MAG: hypothetical protein Q9168_000203 [Polycauliona sp. 1 TL-2023]